MWILYAFSGPVMWALSTHIDKYLVEKYFKHSDTAVLMVFTSLIGVLMLPFIWAFHPDIFALPRVAIAVMIASGILYMGAMLFYLRAIQSEEASVVAPLFQASTLFTFALAYLLLGETLSLLNAAGVALIILGVLFVSFAHFQVGRFKLRLVLLMLAATFVLALSSVLFKYFAVQGDFWGTTFWTFAGEALFGAGILAVPRYARQFAELLKTNTQALLAVNASNELINLFGGLGVRFASLFAPVAVISAISSTTTLFVFFFGVLLSAFAPRFSQESLARGDLMQKGFAALVVAVGVFLANT